MKFSWSFDFAMDPLPLRWNGIGLMVVGGILFVFAIITIIWAIYAQIIGRFAEYPGERWVACLVAVLLLFMASLFLVIGRWLFKTAGPVTDEILAGKDTLITAYANPLGIREVKTQSSLPLIKWIGRIISTAGALMYAGGFFSLFVMQPRPGWSAPIYLFGVGTWILMIGLFFLWYRRKILRAKERLQQTQ